MINFTHKYTSFETSIYYYVIKNTIWGGLTLSVVYCRQLSIYFNLIQSMQFGWEYKQIIVKISTYFIICTSKKVIFKIIF